MKKIISIFLTVAIFIGCAPFSYAEDTENLPERVKESAEVLKVLGFLHSDYSEEYIAQKQNEEVTRGYFAEFISKIFCDDSSAYSAAYYYDVPNTHYAYDAVAALASRGIIAVPEDKMFNPDKTVTVTEAAKMLLYAIGYGEVTEYAGGWETGINKLAADVDLYKGIKSYGALSFSDMLVMVYNSLFAEMLEFNGVSNGNPILETKGNTYLSASLDVYMEKDIVLGFDETAVYGDDVAQGEALVGKRTLLANEIDLTDYLGTEVKYLYRYDEKLDESTLLWLSKTGRSDELILTYADNDVEYSRNDNKFTYYAENGRRSKTVKLAQDVNVILNGCYVKDNVSDVFEKDFYRIKLVASEGNAYDVAFVDSYENYEVLSNDTVNEVLYLKSCDNSSGIAKQVVINLNEYERYDFSGATGEKCEQSRATVGTIVSVFEAQGKERIRIVVCSETVNGEITSISENNGYTIFAIKDREYTVYKDNVTMRANIGAEVEIKLDAYGYVASLKITKGGVSFGFLMKVFLSDDFEEYPFEQRLAFKIFTENGEIERLFSKNKKIMIDGTLYKDLSAAYGELGCGSAKPQLVAYSLNGNGEIKMLDRAEEYGASAPQANNMLQCVSSKASMQYNNWTKNLGSKTRLGSASLVMCVPSNAELTDEKYYGVGNMSLFTHQSYYTAAVYNYGTQFNEFGDVVIVYDKTISGSEWLSTRFVVDKIMLVLNDDDEVVVQATGYHGNAEKSVRFTTEASEMASKLKPGDIFVVNKRLSEDIDDFNVEYSPSASGTRPIDKTYKTTEKRSTMFYVHNIVGSTVQLGYDSGADFNEVITPPSFILVYDRDDGSLRKGSTADIRTYEAAGDSCSSLFVYFMNGEVRNFVVIN